MADENPTNIIAALPTPEQQLLDLECRAEQIRQLKRQPSKLLLFTAIGLAAALFAAGGVVGGLLVRLLSGHG